MLKLRASSTFKWVNCSLMDCLPELREPEVTTKYLQERTDDHKRLEKEEFLQSEAKIKQYYNDLHKSINHDKIVLKESLIETIFSSENTDTSIIVSGHPDVLIFHRKRIRNKAYYIFDIIDWKTGYFEVEAQGNEQLLTYALICARETEKYFNLDRTAFQKGKSVFRFHILNTKSDKPVTTSYSLAEIEFWFTQKISPVFKERLQKNAFAKTGKHCNLCSKKPLCPLFRKDTYKNVLDIYTDELLFELSKRKKEITIAKEALLRGERESKIFTYSIIEYKKREFTDELPNKFKELKPITISEAEKKFNVDEFMPYIIEKNKHLLKIGELKKNHDVIK
jgi:hypothetical protein